MPSRLASLPGVFAYEGLDAGTALLLSCIPDSRGLRVLDIGCGYGAIGIFVGLLGAAHVDLVDSNRLAVAAAHENLTRCTIPGEALASDVLDAVAGRRYDLILSNPPFHVGKAVSYEIAEAFVQQGRTLLAPRGRMLLVANRFIRHDRLLSAAFGNCETLADNGRYWVLMGKN
jgi:16S rRNA (guanine1207-N2)-methyltransferase